MVPEFVADAVTVAASRSASAHVCRGRRSCDGRVVDAAGPGYGGGEYPALSALQIRLSSLDFLDFNTFGEFS